MNDHTFKNPFGQNPSRLSQNNGSCTNSSDQEFVQFRPNSHHQELMDSDDSGVCSPPLWKNSPSSPSQPLLGSHHGYRNLSPDSRLRAITRGQRELMDMVKTMPESSYELSLKDLVEHHKIEAQTPQLNNRSLHQRGGVKVKSVESKKNEKNMMRVESFEHKGLFLKMVVPFSMKSKKKKNSGSNSSGKVSPKPEVVKGGGERDWWKKKFSGSTDSDSSRTSNNSGSTGSSGSGGSSSGRSDRSGGRKKNGLVRGCWSFLKWRSSKSVE